MEKSCLKLGVDDLGERESDIGRVIITTLERRAALSPCSRCSVMSDSTELIKEKGRR